MLLHVPSFCDAKEVLTIGDFLGAEVTKLVPEDQNEVQRTVMCGKINIKWTSGKEKG